MLQMIDEVETKNKSRETMTRAILALQQAEKFSQYLSFTCNHY